MVGAWCHGRTSPISLISPGITRMILTLRVPVRLCIDVSDSKGRVLRRRRCFGVFEQFLQETRHLEARRARERADQRLTLPLIDPSRPQGLTSRPTIADWPVRGSCVDQLEGVKRNEPKPSEPLVVLGCESCSRRTLVLYSLSQRTKYTLSASFSRRYGTTVTTADNPVRTSSRSFPAGFLFP